MFIGKYDKSVVVTYLGILSAITGIYFILGYSVPKVTGAIICLMISGICDMFDGKVARSIKGRTSYDIDYGIQVDSLADMVSFIMLPIIILYGVSKLLGVTLISYIVIPILTLFTVCGISRLSYFNVSTLSEDGKVDFYTGLPVTSTAIIFPLIYLLKYILNPTLFVYLFLLLFLIVSILMISNFKIRKPKKNSWYVICSTLAVIMSIVLLLLKVCK